jgi:DNA-binding response OmpR family regulator
VLDVMLPGIDGLEVCRRVRARAQTPVIMLTARGEEVDKLVGLGLGADDYVTKPFSPRELAARVTAVLRRSGQRSDADGEVIRADDLQINARTRTVENRRGAVPLTAREFDLLHYLARHPRQVFTREQIMDSVWDYEFAGDSSTVTVHMRRLRAKVERDPSRPRYLKTVWGVGYKFEP